MQAEVARTFLPALLSPDGLGPSCVEVAPALDAAWLNLHRLSPYVFYRLQQAGLLGCLPDAVRAALQLSYYKAVANHTVLTSELDALLVELRAQDVNPIVLKGMALGVTLYPSPTTRPTLDLDLLVERDQLGLVRKVLEVRGYRDKGLNQERRQAFCSHLHMWRESPRIMVEAHWHLVHDPGYARRVDLGGFYSRARPADFGGYSALVLDPMDQLIHACAHLSFTHNQNWDLLWLLDLGLLVQCYRQSWDWAEVASRSEKLGLAGSVLYWLELTETWYGALVPAQARQALARAKPGAEESWYIEKSRLAKARVWNFAWRRAFGGADLKRGLAYLGEIFFPPWAYMQYRYGARTRWLAPVYYAWRLVRASWVAFRRVGPASASGRMPRPG